MTFILGPLYSGKRDFACKLLRCRPEELEQHARWDVQDLVTRANDLEQLAEELSAWPVVIATETGGGVVPVEAEQRAAREAAGRLSCLLAQRADTVVRVFYGLPLVLKGSLSE